MKRIIYSLLAASTLCFATSCDLDLLDNPNAVTASTASPDFLLNSIQLDYKNLYNSVSNDGMELTRIINQGSAQYESAYTVSSTNAYWSTAYANILADIQFLEPLAEQANFQRHLGIAKTIKAMVLFHLVDSYGDVPLSEALDAGNFFPKTDSGESVYSAALESLNQASAHFAATSAGSPNDYFYAGNYTKWIRLVNTMKLRYHLNLKLVNAAGSKTAINALIAEGNLLKEGDDFAFRFGTNSADPDSRHPGYAGSYTSGGGTYHSTFYMWHMTEAKGFDDPRARFYWYRQVTTNPKDPALIECLTIIAPPQYLVQNFIYCLPGTRGYWGRDHLDPDGVPPDGLLRTVWGLYPSGGRFDDNSATPVNNPTLGAQGAGLFPIMLSSYVDFMLAEAALTINNDPATAKTYMLAGIKKHMNYVINFANNSQESGKVSAFFAKENIDLTKKVNEYIAYVGNEYDLAPAGNKMYLIGREYWLALYGNGVEALNLYKRTGQPSKMQPGLEPDAGLFPRTFLYPNNYIVTNSNAVQKPNLGVQTFWDKNPAGNGWIY
ncbi:SusD-like starch-binding protein associating with outer membrane [Algoriphagus ratkowskyi]|uniref:SusD-like starch-binding protein associating with outer membrane n=1 Tax=Algoriphagus ratkowskyi TaxID=57028 RepID=A0A2W7RY12_9BACT|nr:SusD/RagB family nutrient-binding outer membrane lipoprotein [Algoriphagus ratkowskyi]PZX60107.1 SusD-like starch-binding protein associating with outer membrane [Algoriphagus ratkowskyi]TXD75653.1 SusD/RagB family nutrient-binding outer membrane lipoprotein [Algoriphagus ratkowskyi]